LHVLIIGGTGLISRGIVKHLLARVAAETFADLRRRNAWRDSSTDSLYQGMIDEAFAAGVDSVPA
jgi:uncharacterized protein YbjT (DUF2867 family)